SYAAARSTGRRRIGFPPGGRRSPSSNAQSASRISSIVTGAFSPSGARSDGHEAIAEASEVHDARIARFSERLRVGICARLELSDLRWLSTTWLPLIIPRW